jgi:glycosyltransferase involved in cell wall biosynthesis
MKTAPMISICIPVYNGGKYLRYTIESALSQTYRDFEIVIVDDQSTDDSSAIIEEFSRRDSRIRTFRNSDRNGLVGNWNECIRKASGVWIKFLFQDDLMSEVCLERMIKFYQSFEKGHKVIFCKRELMLENGFSGDENYRRIRDRKYIWDIYPRKPFITTTVTARLIVKYSGSNIFGEPSSFLIHRTIFDQFGLFDDSFYHICDVEYWLRVGLNAQMLLVPEVLVFFRVHADSTTSFNLREKRMQMRHLDRLRLFSKFLSDEHYAPLRKVMVGWPCNMYLTTKTAIFLRRVRIEIGVASHGRWPDEFVEFSRENANLMKMANENYFVLAVKYATSRMGIEICWLYSLLKVFSKLR